MLTKYLTRQGWGLTESQGGEIEFFVSLKVASL